MCSLRPGPSAQPTATLLYDLLALASKAVLPPAQHRRDLSLSCPETAQQRLDAVLGHLQLQLHKSPLSSKQLLLAPASGRSVSWAGAQPGLSHHVSGLDLLLCPDLRAGTDPLSSQKPGPQSTLLHNTCVPSAVTLRTLHYAPVKQLLCTTVARPHQQHPSISLASFLPTARKTYDLPNMSL